MSPTRVFSVGESYPSSARVCTGAGMEVRGYISFAAGDPGSQ
jgi:hypothetical protein